MPIWKVPAFSLESQPLRPPPPAVLSVVRSFTLVPAPPCLSPLPRRHGEGRCHGHGEGGRQGPGEDRGRPQGDAQAGAALLQAGGVLQRRVRGAVPPGEGRQREEGGQEPAGRPVLERDHRSRSHHRRRVLRRAVRGHGLRRRARRREPARRDVQNQTGCLPQVPASEIVRAVPGVHAGGGGGVHEPLRGPVRAPLRRKLFPVGVGFPQPLHGHAQDRRRLLPRPPPPRLRHRPALPLLRHVEGSAAVRGAGAGDGGGVLAGLRGLAGGRVLHGLPADGVAAVRAVCGGRADGGGEGRRRHGLRLVALRLQRVRQRAQAVVPLHHAGAGPALRRAHLLEPLPRRRVPALRALLLLRLASRALHADARPAAAHRPRAADAVRRQGTQDPLPSAAAGAAVPADAEAVVPAVAVHVPQGRAGQPGGARARVLPAVPALLPPALRRDNLPRHDAAAARRAHSHRRRGLQAHVRSAAAASARRSAPSPVPAAPPSPPSAPEDLSSCAARRRIEQPKRSSVFDLHTAYNIIQCYILLSQSFGNIFPRVLSIYSYRL